MADLTLANSQYQTGSIDTATTLVDNVDEVKAQHPNGSNSAIVQIETILGVGTTLKGNLADLVSRLAVLMDANGKLNLTGFVGLTTNSGLLATSSTQMAVFNHTPVGLICPYGGSSAPTHWLLCDGSPVSRTTYSKLFTAIGTAYGVGDGSTTFNVPDYRGRVPVGVDGAANRITAASTNGGNADTLGGVGGTETHTLTTAQMASHVHGEQVMNSINVAAALLDDNAGGSSGLTIIGNATAFSDSGAPLTTASTGGGSAHSNTQPWQTCNFIIFAMA